MSLWPTSKKKKAELFNSSFAKQCSLINNDSKLPTNFTYITEKCLDNVTFSIEEIGNIIQGLDPNKARGQDKINVRIQEICVNSVCKTLKIIYRECLSLVYFSWRGKRERLSNS